MKIDKTFIELQNNDPSLTYYGIVIDDEVVGNIENNNEAELMA